MMPAMRIVAIRDRKEGCKEEVSQLGLQEGGRGSTVATFAAAADVER